MIWKKSFMLTKVAYIYVFIYFYEVIFWGILTLYCL